MDDELLKGGRWYDVQRAGETAAALTGALEAMAQAAERSGNLDQAAHIYGTLVRVIGPKAWSDQAQGWELEYLLQEKRLRDEIAIRHQHELDAAQHMTKLLAFHTYMPEN